MVTGASSGIGLELAKQFARHGYDLVVTADNQLDEATASTRGLGVEVVAVQTDLARPEGVEELAGRITDAGRPVAVAALNAGIGTNGAFLGSATPDEHLRVVDLNVRSTVHLAHRILASMKPAGRGKMLFTSSVAATSPGPYMSVYNASKAFIKSFAEALRDELRGTGLTITTLMPGPTDTEFFDRAGMTDTKLGTIRKDSAADVAKQGYDALMAGKDHVVAGSFKNKVQAVAGHLLPDPVLAAVHRRMTKPGTGN